MPVAGVHPGASRLRYHGRGAAAWLQDLDLRSLVKVACALLDIPVHGDNPVEAMHLLFSLLAEFQASPFFGQAAGAAQALLGRSSAPHSPHQQRLGGGGGGQGPASPGARPGTGSSRLGTAPARPAQ